MAAIKTYESTEYLNELTVYLVGLFSKWLDITEIKEQKTAVVLEVVQKYARTNYRITYLKLLLPFISENHLIYYKTHQLTELTAIRKIVHSMLINDIRYNDHNVNRLAESMLNYIGEGSPSLSDSLHSDFMDVQKLLWTFIVQFKKKRNLPIVSDGRVEFY
jgi:hypothetical protein